MADITPGTGGTLKSASAENALLEVAMLVQNLERTPANNPDNRNFCQVTINTDAGTATVTSTFPIAPVVGADGKITIEAVEYLT